MENKIPFVNQDYLLESIATFCHVPIDDINVHYMFNYHILSLKRCAFAMVIDGRLALKFGNNKQLKEQLLKMGGKVVLDYSTVTKKMSYLSVHEDCSVAMPLETKMLLKSIMNYWHNIGHLTPNSSISNVININRGLASHLNNIGIDSLEELKVIGSSNVYQKIKSINPNVPNSYYSRLEGAIINKHYMFVDEFYMD